MRMLPEKTHPECEGCLLRCYSPGGIKEEDEKASQEAAFPSLCFLASHEAGSSFPLHHTMAVMHCSGTWATVDGRMDGWMELFEIMSQNKPSKIVSLRHLVTTKHRNEHILFPQREEALTDQICCPVLSPRLTCNGPVHQLFLFTSSLWTPHNQFGKVVTLTVKVLC